MTHYLTRAVLNRKAPEHALRPLLDPLDADAAFDAHHRLMWTLFPDPDAKRDFLWRADDNGKFLILSAREPQGSRLFEPLESKPFEPMMAAGDRLVFILRANATKDRRSGPQDDVPPGTKRRPRKDRRVDIVMHAMRERRESRAGPSAPIPAPPGAWMWPGRQRRRGSPLRVSAGVFRSTRWRSRTTESAN